MKKTGQYNSVEYSLKIRIIFSHFKDYSKSAWWMILFCLVTCYHTPTLHKNAEKPTVMRFFTQILFESTMISIHSPTNPNHFKMHHRSSIKRSVSQPVSLSIHLSHLIVNHMCTSQITHQPPPFIFRCIIVSLHEGLSVHPSICPSHPIVNHMYASLTLGGFCPNPSHLKDLTLGILKNWNHFSELM